MSGLTHAVELYKQWLNDPHLDEEIRRELEAIEGDTKEIEDRFYKDLEFGTGGLRGIIGAGSNRVNIYTVGKATQGLAQYLLKKESASGGKSPSQEEQPALSVVIAHDSRHRSAEFALETALVFAGNGIRAYVFESLRPTPELSFAVRELKADAGVVITASHNPPEYNGYKVYGEDGCQLVPHLAEQVISEIRGITSFSEVRKLSREEAEQAGLLVWIGEDIDKRYIEAVAQVSFSQDDALRKQLEQVKVVYTPLHGAGNKLVRQALEAIGVKQLYIVPEQEQPDPDFSTVQSPNPEEREAFTIALQAAEREGADIVVGTDPDADRMGAAVKHGSEYVLLSGNQAGALMLYYLLERMRSEGKLPANGVVIKTIVTSEMGATIAKHFGLTVMNTLTGFKYIGEKMTQFAESGEHEFVFGYEESYGYLAGTYARDKDAVLASMLICEAAAYYKGQGKTLIDVLEALYEQFGYFQEHLESRTYKGIEGMEKIKQIMNEWREHAPTELIGRKVVQVLDYAQGIDNLPKENVLKFILEDGTWFCVRPSGTEPKIKVYFAVCGRTAEESAQTIQSLIEVVMAKLD